MARRVTRRQFIARFGGAGLAIATMGSAPLRALARAARPLTASQRRTLDAALARMIPSAGPGDWSAADLGVGTYIERILAGTAALYAGGPYRRNFGAFQRLWRAKRIAWSRETRRLRALYRAGLNELDRHAGGDFAAAPSAVQDAVLQELDLEGSPFFGALYAHTMEGTYAHPVYGGNANYRAWKTFGYQGDVHGVRFPKTGSRGSWNTYGGYAPEEMGRPG